MTVRPMRPDEAPLVVAMLKEIWSQVDDDFGDETVYVWERPEGGLGGCITFSLRPWAEGCESEPVPYVEGWYVAADLRRTGVGRALVEAVEAWCREYGYVELGSDAELHNDVSLRAHEALGFERTLRVQYFRKRLR